MKKKLTPSGEQSYANITASYVDEEGNDWKLEGKGELTIAVEEPERDTYFGNSYDLLDKIVNPDNYSLRVKLVPRGGDGPYKDSYYTLTKTGTRKRVQLKKGIKPSVNTILNAQESVDAPVDAQITMGEGWIEFYWAL